eukprot:3299536-Prymnesium_polylepis.1
MASARPNVAGGAARPLIWHPLPNMAGGAARLLHLRRALRAPFRPDCPLLRPRRQEHVRRQALSHPPAILGVRGSQTCCPGPGAKWLNLFGAPSACAWAGPARHAAEACAVGAATLWGAAGSDEAARDETGVRETIGCYGVGGASLGRHGEGGRRRCGEALGLAASACLAPMDLHGGRACAWRWTHTVARPPCAVRPLMTYRPRIVYTC